MAEAQTGLRGVPQHGVADVREERSKPDIRRFAMLAGALALLLVVFRAYGLEQPAFFSLSCLVFSGFAVAYWLPFRFKEPFLILLSLAGAYVLLSPLVASLLIAVGVLIFAVLRTSLDFRWKVLLLLVMLLALGWARAAGWFPALGDFWPVFAAVFMFRTVLYTYDLKHARGPADLKSFLSYFFLLPNYYFLLFPVIDFQTFRKNYFKRDIHVVAAQGVWWIFRGTTQILFYRIIYQYHGIFTPPRVSVPVAVAVNIASCYLLYTRITGQFHIIAGMLCLFGYDMPETNHRYLLSRGIADFWRRTNIYWKDFMVKAVYFPAYFKFRRGGELQAKLLATVMVFVVTWFLHGYQFFWLQGNFHFSLNDTLFWLAMGGGMVADVLLTSSNPKRQPRSGIIGQAVRAIQIVLTFCAISVLWSMWSANSLTQWFEFLKTGSI